MDNTVPRVQLKRVNPFMGLMIDAQTWGDSHDYHRLVNQAHHLAMHGWGIVTGLEVDAADPADRSVWIRPGVAIDPEGRLIIVSQPFRYQITTDKPGLMFLVLMFREIPTQPAISIEDGSEKPSRLLEAYAIYERDRLPDQPHVELARISLTSDKKAAVKDPANATAPSNNEIDGRYRELAGIRPGPRVSIGIWKPDSSDDGMSGPLAGVARLVAELSTSSIEWRIRRRDHLGGAEEPLDTDLLIMPITSKSGINGAEGNMLDVFLDTGGVLLVETSGAAGADAQKVIGSVAQAVKRKPGQIGRNHPLLTSRYVFSAPPGGAVQGQLVEGDGLLVSTSDYSSAWNGGTDKKPLERPEIRTAIEFAENLLAYALLRRANARRVLRNKGGK
jgi:hypothetical protein